MKDKRGIVGGFLNNSNNLDNLKANWDVEDGVIEHLTDVTIVYGDSSVKIPPTKLLALQIVV